MAGIFWTNLAAFTKEISPDGSQTGFEMECRADSRIALNQWETSLQSNAVSHWLGANLESAMEWLFTWSCVHWDVEAK